MNQSDCAVSVCLCFKASYLQEDSKLHDIVPLFVMSMQITVVLLDPANSNSVTRFPRYFKLGTGFLDFFLSHLLSAISNSRCFEQFFVSPASWKWWGSTVFVMPSPIPFYSAPLFKFEITCSLFSRKE